MKKQSFENYLQEHFISLNEYGGIPIIKDNCEDLFENWLEQCDVAEIIELAEKWGEVKETAADISAGGGVAST